MTSRPLFAFTRPATSRAKAAAALSAAVVFGYVVAVVQAHDPRLDEAHQALQKAFALVEASQTGGAPPQTQRLFDRHRERAMDFITRAMEEVVLAGEIADGQ
jgi:hypothetical protein